MKFRIGYGYDVHASAKGCPDPRRGRNRACERLHRPFGRGCGTARDQRRLLGAAALGDIGLHFPDTSDEFKGADSKLLLARCVELLREKGYAVGNVDCTISMQRPKLRPHIDRMRETIARTIGIDTDAVSVKATTTERLGFEGREEGVSVAAVALIYRE